jgi:hypothetical protein
MPTSLDNRLVPVAYDIIQRLGTNATFLHYGAGVYDPTTGIGAPAAAHTTPITLKVSPPAELTEEMIKDDIVPKTAMYVILPAQGLSSIANFSVRLGMEVSITGRRHECIKIEPLYSGDLIAAYILYLNR